VPEKIAAILNRKGRSVWSISPEATVYEALSLMAEKDIGALAVISEGRLVGMFSERDYARKVILLGRSSKEVRVSEIMTAQVVTVGPDHTVDECMVMMTTCRVRHLPVLEDGRVTGMISIGDLVNAIISDQEHTIKALSAYISGGYPA
jgi:CBS domain-containing protein